MGVCGFYYEFPPTPSVNVNISVPTISVAISQPSVGYPSLDSIPTLPSPSPLSVNLTPYSITESISISGIRIPTLSPVAIDFFTPYIGDIPTLVAPAQHTYRDEVPELDYEKFKKPLNLYSYFTFPLSVAFPPLPLSQNVLVPEFSFNLDIIENELETIEPKILINHQQHSFVYNAKGTYFSNVGYADYYYNKEKDFFEILFRDVEKQLDYLQNIDSFMLYIDALLDKEGYGFNKHLSQKNRALIKMVTSMKIYKEVLQNKIKQLEATLTFNKNKVESIITENKFIFDLWLNKQETGKTIFKGYLDYIDKSSSLYKIATDINSDLRNLFMLYNQFLALVIEASVLNIERERLILEASIANMSINLAKEKESIAPIKRDLLLMKNDLITKQLEAVTNEYDSLFIRADALNTIRDSFNVSLDAYSKTIDATAKKLNARGQLLVAENEYKLFDRTVSMFNRMVEEWFSIQKTYTATKWDINRYTTMNNTFLQKQISNEIAILGNYISYHYSQIVNAYAHFLSHHAWASSMIANANITSNVIEAYR